MKKRLPEVDVEETGKTINRMMLQKGFCVKDIQREFGFATPQAVYKWIRGKSIPSIDNLVILACILGATIDEIVCRKEDEDVAER